jgi:hypothetical protein
MRVFAMSQQHMLTVIFMTITLMTSITLIVEYTHVEFVLIVFVQVSLLMLVLMNAMEVELAIAEISVDGAWDVIVHGRNSIVMKIQEEVALGTLAMKEAEVVVMQNSQMIIHLIVY